MVFEQIASGGCRSYLVGCRKSRAALLIDPEHHQIDRCLALAAREGVPIRHVIDTHTRADHFSGARQLAAAAGAAVAAHRLSPAPYVDMRLKDGDILRVGEMKLKTLHTPGHTRDSICLLTADRVFTGDTLLIGGTGRTYLPTGDAEALYDSLHRVVLKLDPAMAV
jgi:glyoxylase-like metal-dependent hydrolase (beta-lactamase superfamily II)